MKPPTTCLLLLHAALDQYKRADPLHTHFTNAALYSYTCPTRRSRQRQLFPVTATTPNAAPHPPHPRVSTRPGRERPGRRHHCPAAAAATTTSSSSTTTTTRRRRRAAAAAVLVLAKHGELASEGLCRRAREATRPAAATGFKTNAASEQQDGQPDKESSRRKRRWRRRWWRET